jgi:hypothetical protein
MSVIFPNPRGKRVFPLMNWWRCNMKIVKLDKNEYRIEGLSLGKVITIYNALENYKDSPSAFDAKIVMEKEINRIKGSVS